MRLFAYALFAVVASVVVLMNWLIARRARAFAHRDTPDPRSAWEMRAGCLVPFVNLFWAPVYLLFGIWYCADGQFRFRC